MKADVVNRKRAMLAGEELAVSDEDGMPLPPLRDTKALSEWMKERRQSEQFTCAYCGATVTGYRQQRERRYCSDSHRTMDYRRRKRQAAAPQEPPADE